MRRPRVIARMLTPIGVGFYSYNGRKVFGDTAGDVDEVIESTFFYSVFF